MSHKPAILPSLNALRTFESAARHASFKSAANELFVTQAAVSRQIRQLEEQLDSSLFIRSHRKVELTTEGRELYKTVHQSFQDISETVNNICQRNRPEEISFHVTSSFARLWLLPRLNILREHNPELQLKLISTEESPLMADKFDAAITLGLEEYSGYQADFLFAEEIFPVCSPDFLNRYPDVGKLDNLLQRPLLDLDPQYWKARWWTPVDWIFWLEQCHPSHQDVRAEMAFSHYSLLLDAVLQGIGAGLGWHHLVQDMLADRRLVRPVSESYQAPSRQHYFVCRDDIAHRPDILFLRQWLLQQTESLRKAEVA